ncbi:MAG: hypothetical protein ABR534_14645, partial [Desulfotignum sp.]
VRCSGELEHGNDNPGKGPGARFQLMDTGFLLRQNFRQPGLELEFDEIHVFFGQGHGRLSP